MRTLKLMADYDCFPLWEASPGQVGNIDPETLNISAELKGDLAEWARFFDQTLNRDDPANSGFASTEAENAFKMQGRTLGERLQTELGAAYVVKVKV